MNAAGRPELYVVRNPSENLAPEEKVEVVRYLVHLKEIRAKGEKKA